MMQINFESTYDDYLLKKIYETVIDFSVSNVFLEINNDKFLEIINQHIHDIQTYEKIDYIYSKSTNNLEPFITKTLIAPGFAAIYGINNTNEDSETEIDFDFEKNGVWTASNFTFYFAPALADKMKQIVIELKNNITTQDIKNRFYTIGAGMEGYILNPETVNSVDINLTLNYGNKFPAAHNEILNVLKNQFHGLVLLFGEPGCGKTMYIRYLINLLCNDKTIIYVPAYMVEQIANPEFISFIQRFKESILILEDAEFALQSRNEEYGAQAVSNLLNITNGLLNDITKIQVIATFNMEKKNIDKALLRPGRLLKEWKFDKLSIDEAKELAKSLNKNINITSAMTLAEIYTGKTQHKKVKKRIGIKDEE